MVKIAYAVYLYMLYTAHQLDNPCLSLKLLGYARNIDPLTQPPGKRSYSMFYNQGRRHSETRPQAPVTFSLRDRSLITGRGWLQNGKNTGPILFTFPSPPQDRVTLSALLLLKSGNFFRPHSVWLNFKLPCQKYPKTCPPPPASICSAAPLPVINERSLRVV